MRVVLFGYQTWGHKTLEALVKSRHDVVAVVTHPVSEQAYESIWSDSVEDLARDHGIDVHLAKRPDEALMEQLRQWAPDIIVANNWRTWLPPEIFAMPRYGTVNLHDSLLPAFTGFSPVIWALISGAAETGLTAHRMDRARRGDDRADPRGAVGCPGQHRKRNGHMDAAGSVETDLLSQTA